MNRESVFEWHKRFKEGTESVRDDERCGRSKEVNTPLLIGKIQGSQYTTVDWPKPNQTKSYIFRV